MLAKVCQNPKNGEKKNVFNLQRTVSVFTFLHPRNKMFGNAAKPQTARLLSLLKSPKVKSSFNLSEQRTAHVGMHTDMRL